MKFSVIGSGNMAWFLGTRLHAAGHVCTGVYSRNTEQANTLADHLATQGYNDVNRLAQQHPDVCIIAISDNAISTIVSQLQPDNTVLVHTSGTTSIDVLLPATPYAAVLWPVYSILKNDLPSHRNVPCAWEASSPEAAATVQEIAAAVTDNVFEANSEKRQWLHMTAVLCNNFINHIIAIGSEICTEQSLPFSVLSPILQQTFHRAENHAPYDVQTGPARRGDTTTIEKHLALLQQHPQWQAVYKAISASIENMYQVNDSKKI